jgi:hypothetical protein
MNMYICWIYWNLFQLTDILHHIFHRIKVYLVWLFSAEQMRLLKHYTFMPKREYVGPDSGVGPSSSSRFNCSSTLARHSRLFSGYWPFFFFEKAVTGIPYRDMLKLHLQQDIEVADTLL